MLFALFERRDSGFKSKLGTGLEIDSTRDAESQK